MHCRHAVAATAAAVLAAATASAQAPAPPTVSGTIRGNYHYLVGGPREDFNQFAIDRVYLTVRGRVAPRTSFRVTSDVFESGDDNGWTVRMKYAYLDHVLNEGAWATSVRAGLLQTVAIEQQEAFWPRWLGPTALDRHRYFQSADAGVSVTTELPASMGEVFAHVVNGSGSTRRETDRFKDFAARVSLTPLAARAGGLLGTATLTAWAYEGATAGGAGALQRDRWGVHAAVDGHRLTMAVEHARRADETERVSEAEPPGAPALIVPTEGTISTAFAIARPWGAAAGPRKPPFGLIARYDHVGPAGGDGGTYHYLLAGALYALSSRVAVSLNYQEQAGAMAPSPFRGAFANFTLDF